jgi:hypothetical protein
VQARTYTATSSPASSSIEILIGTQANQSESEPEQINRNLDNQYLTRVHHTAWPVRGMERAQIKIGGLM